MNSIRSIEITGAELRPEYEVVRRRFEEGLGFPSNEAFGKATWIIYRQGAACGATEMVRRIEVALKGFKRKPWKGQRVVEPPTFAEMVKEADEFLARVGPEGEAWNEVCKMVGKPFFMEGARVGIRCARDKWLALTPKDGSQN